MQYIKVKWLHSYPNEPVWLYSELDDNRWEVRKVYVFPNATIEYACSNGNIGSTMLGLEPIPPLEEINADPKFIGNEITADEFEGVWSEALNKNDHTGW